MKITAVETIPVTLPVGTFADGMCKIAGNSAPPRHDEGRVDRRGRPRNRDGCLSLSNVIVKVHTDEGLTGLGERCHALDLVGELAHVARPGVGLQPPHRVVADAVQHLTSCQVPATALRSLPNARFFVTLGAAKQLRQRQVSILAQSPEVSDEAVGRASMR